MSSHWASRSAVVGIGSAMMELMSPEPQRYERVDLHTHSSWSDGVLTPAELVALAATRQVQLLALTDHDTLAGRPPAPAARPPPPPHLFHRPHPTSPCPH